jgi:glycosidase
MYAVAFSFGGIPLIYTGDELALRNDGGWAARPSAGALHHREIQPVRGRISLPPWSFLWLTGT